MAERDAHIEKIKTDIIQAQKRFDNITDDFTNLKNEVGSIVNKLKSHIGAYKS